MAYGSGRFVAGVSCFQPECEMVRLNRRRLLFRLAKLRSGTFWSFWNSSRKAMPDTIFGLTFRLAFMAIPKDRVHWAMC